MIAAATVPDLLIIEPNVFGDERPAILTRLPGYAAFSAQLNQRQRKTEYRGKVS